MEALGEMVNAGTGGAGGCGVVNDTFDMSTIGPSAQFQDFNLFQKTGTST